MSFSLIYNFLYKTIKYKILNLQKFIESTFFWNIDLINILLINCTLEGQSSNSLLLSIKAPQSNNSDALSCALVIQIIVFISLQIKMC